MILDHILAQLEQHEMIEFMQLLSYKVLLSSSPDEWKQPANEFVNLCIPQEVISYIEDITKGDPKKMRISTDLLIRDLIMRGLISISNETGGVENINTMMNQIIDEGIPEQ